MSYKIFLIEDNRTTSFLYKIALNAFQNLELSFFYTGEELLESLDQKPDIVICDYRLPDMSGKEVIESIMKQEIECKIIVVSSQRDMDIVEDLQNMGISNYIVKSETCVDNLVRAINDQIIILDHMNAAN